MPRSSQNDDLRRWCRANWDRVPSLVRKDCVDYLETKIPIDVIRKWSKEGYNSSFHFGAGMMIRNALRDQLTDGELPEIKCDMQGQSYMARNWDDYYTGALDELLERYNEDGTKK